MNAAEERAAFWQETKHRMTRRLAGWDYCQRAIYMITVTLEDRRGEPLGKLEGSIAENGESQNGPSSVPGHSCAGLKWAEGFQDIVLLHEGQLKAMIAYLSDNPRRLSEKRANPALFTRVAHIELPLDGGRLVGSFEALGNRHLLERPLVQVQCSRRFFTYRREAKRGGGMKIARTPDGEPIIESESPEYRERLESALAAAAHGAVVLSPCISDGERQIAREAMKRRLPLVALKNMGFAKLEKPVGRSFDACAEGRLLLLAPAAWPYTTQEKPMTRFDAIALNRIAQWLTAGPVPGHSCPGFPAEINYHGMKPANIDELAEKAVLARKGGAR